VPFVEAGAGWEVRFCPRGRSTDILRVFGEEVQGLGAGRGLSAEGWGRVRSWGFVEGREMGWGSGGGVVRVCWGVVVGVVAVVVGLVL
jgi:hypothetical protein